MALRTGSPLLVVLVLIASLAGCRSQDTPSGNIPVYAPSVDDSGLVLAQHARCDQGAAILRYLATGDNGGDPSMDQLFASDVGVPLPQARALADKWIEACDQQAGEEEAAASSSAAAQVAQASASAASAAASASQAQHDAQVLAQQQRSCTAIGGQAHDGICQSDSAGHVTGDPYYPCSALVVQFTEDGTIDPGSLQDVNADHPGCFG
jgi:hypothetical protein